MKLPFSPAPSHLERYFVPFAAILGLVYIFMLPPFHSPDEFNHFYRIYNITEGNIFPELNGDRSHLGGYIPRSLKTVSAPFERAVFHPEIKIPADTILKYIRYPLNKKDTVFVDYVNTARYPPTSYLPQIVAVGVLKTFHTPPLLLLYAARLASFLFWFWIIGLTIRTTPVFKNLFRVLALLPTCAAISSSASADVVSNVLLLWQIGFLLKWKFSDSEVSAKEKRIFFVLFLT